MRILLVQHDPTMSQGLATTFHAAAMQVDIALSGCDALEMAGLYDHDLVLLDLSLPDMAGTEVIRRMRAGRLETPVLVLCDTTDRQARLKCFELGADDVVAMPFDLPELMARIHAVVRRTKGFSQPTLTVGPLSLNLGTREVQVKGQSVHLTGKEYAILELLALRKGMVLTKDVFLNHLYGGIDEPEMKIIDVFVCKMRKKLAQAGAGALIGTIWGRGYVLREPRAVVRPVAMESRRSPLGAQPATA
jgi:two-component system cell cycle response regulator CtrA